MSLKERLMKVRSDAEENIGKSETSDELESFRVKFLGKRRSYGAPFRDGENSPKRKDPLSDR